MELIQFVKFKLQQVIPVSVEGKFTATAFYSYSICKTWNKSLVKGEAMCLFYQGQFLNTNIADCLSANVMSLFLKLFYLIRQVNPEQLAAYEDGMKPKNIKIKWYVSLFYE